MSGLTIEEAYRIVDSVEGWLSRNEIMALLELPSYIADLPGSMVEIGSYKGKSTIALGLGYRLFTGMSRTLYAIDLFQPNDIYTDYLEAYDDEFILNIHGAGLHQDVIPIRKFSHEAIHDCTPPFALLFIDGDHRYESVKADILTYVPHIVPQGIIAFHDYDDKNGFGVVDAVTECMDTGPFELLYQADTLRIYRKLG